MYKHSFSYESLDNDILGQFSQIQKNQQVNDVFLMMERKQDIFIHVFNWNDIIAQSFATRIWTFFPPKRICDTILSSLITSIYQNVLDLAISRQMLIAGMEKHQKEVV